MADLKLTLLGGFEMRLTSGAVADLPGQKDRALLAFLAMATGDSHSRERLAGLLWSESADQQARDSLKQALMRLRRCFDAVDSDILRADRLSIGLDRGTISVDVVAFEGLVRENTREALSKAVALYRGDLLDGLAVRDTAFEEWLLVERQRLHQLFERALAELMSQALAAGDREQAATVARRLTLIDPLSEAACRTLMQVHAEEGQTAQALKLYDGLRERLHRELGVQPEPETVALRDRIRSRRAKGEAPAAALASESPPAAVAATPAKPSIAVLPFVNLSGDPEQAYFADGITEDMITDLSRFRLLDVVASTVSSRYRDTTDVQRIGRELGVAYAVLGSVRRLGGRIRLTAQLVETASGNQVWAERFDRAGEDFFIVADDLVRTIAGTVAGRLQAAGFEQVRRKPPANLAAYDCVLRARSVRMRVGDPEAEAELQRLYEQAVALDPAYGRAYAGLAMVHMRAWFRDPTGSDAGLQQAHALAQQAATLDQDDSECQEMVGWVLLHRQCFDLAEQYYRRAIELNPNSPDELATMGALIGYLGRPEEGISWFEQARRIDPFFDPSWYWHLLGTTCFNARRYDDAVAAYGRSTTPPVWVVAYLAASHALAGRSEQAAGCAAEVIRRSPDFSAATLAAKEPYKLPADRAHLLDGLRRAGLPERPRGEIGRRGDPVGSVASPDSKPSIAVLPFVNLSGGPEQDYFSDGITEDIITELSRFRALLVIARNSSFQYRGGNLDVTRIGRELGARYLAEGSIRRIGDRIRITAQLIDATTGNHIWAERYDRDAADILAVQDEIVRAVATTLGDRIDADSRARALRLSPERLSAHDHVLRSEAHFMRFIKEENAEARRLALKAIELDPQSAEAHASVGWTHCMDHLFGWVEERDLSTALALGQRAVLLDPADCRARILLGFVHIFRREYDEAVAQLRTAIALNPNDVEARGVYAVYLVAVGDPEGALEQHAIAKRNNPFELDWMIVCRGMALFTARCYDDAIDTLMQAHNPTHEQRFWLTASYAAAGRLAEARAALADFLATAERDMARFPGRRLDDWKPDLHRLIEYRDPQEFERLFAALRAAGLE